MKKRLNIAALSRTTYWHGMHGGMDVHGKLLAQGLVARGHRVVFISTRHPAGKTYEIINGVEIHYLKDTVFGSRRCGWARESVRTLQALHRKNPFDLFWSQSYDGFGLTQTHTAVRHIPLLSTLHGSIQQEFTTFIANLRRGWYRPGYVFKTLAGLCYSYFITQKPVLQRSRGIIVVSRRIVDDLKKWFGRDVTKKCAIVYNGIDTEHFRPDPKARSLLRSRYALQENNVVLLTLGRLTHEKGHHVLIEAMRILRQSMPDIKLLVVGDGENLPRLQALTEHLGLSEAVIFTGMVDNSETSSYYNASDIFVFPTLTIEGLPFVLMEAMACGKPVIASNIGGNSEVIRNGKNGILVNPGEKTVIADKLAMLVKNRRLAESLGRAAETTVKKDFCIKRMIDLTETKMIDVSAEPALV
jgi:glycosyltransferase involved in cell wall biosynthesis